MLQDILMSCWSYKPGDRPDFVRLLNTFEKLPKKRLVRSPSHPIQLSRSAESVFWGTPSRARTGSVGGDQPLFFSSKLWDNASQQDVDLKGNYPVAKWLWSFNYGCTFPAFLRLLEEVIVSFGLLCPPSSHILHCHYFIILPWVLLTVSTIYGCGHFPSIL